MVVENTTGFQLSPQQRRLWNLQAAGLSECASVVISVEGDLDAVRLRSALEAVVQRFEILRTSFQRSSGLKFPFQVVHGEAAVAWETAALRGPSSEQAAGIEKILRAQSARIDLAMAPVVRVTLVAVDDRRHLLLVSLPSLCADRHGLELLVQHLAETYAGNAATEEVLQYADYAAWQNELPQEEEAAQAGEFWKAKNPADVPRLALPFVKAGTTAPGAEARIPLTSDGTTEAVPFPRSDENARAHQLSVDRVPISLDGSTKSAIEKAGLESFLLAAWQTFLWRMSGQAEIVSGFHSDGRQYEEAKNALGTFSRMLPLRAGFDSDPKFDAFLEQTRQGIAQAQESQDYLPSSYSECEPGVYFGIRDTAEPYSGGGVAFSIAEIRVPEHRAHLGLQVEKASDDWNAVLVFDQPALSLATAEHFAGCFATLVRGAAAQPETVVSRLPLLNEDERERVVTTFNRTAVEFPSATCLHYLFEEKALRTPSRPALRCGETALSYAELNAQANQIAHALRRYGVKANVPVGLCVERSAEMIVGLLGILKAGGCYVPLVPDSPKARLAHQLKETGAPVLLTQEKLLGDLPDFAGAVLCLDRDREKFAAESSANPEHNIGPQDLAYVIYTSGSTGVPKGVAVRHASLVNYTRFIERRLDLASHPDGLHFATVSTIAADLGNTAVFPALVSGGCLHVIGFEMAMAANLFSDYAAKYPIDVLKITPSHLNTLMKASGSDAVLPRKFLVLGGEASSWEFIRQIMQAGKCAVLNHYGPTEATIGCCTFAVWENDVSAWNPATVPVGRPIANDCVYILDRHMAPVPVGVAGELCIGGTGLAQGYLNQPEQTAERFVANPFRRATDSESRIYRTGDLARFLPDGNIEFMGRIDDQVKIRGFRVEPAEIQNALRKCAGVQQTVVTPYQDKNGEKRLAAYVVAGTGTKADQLRTFLQGVLPEYMVPSAIVMLEKLPLTPNGKVDFRALPSPEAEGAKVERPYVAPVTPEEEKMAAIWREVLRVERVSIHDNFFEMGGHSLLATQIISRIRNNFQVQMPLHSFLETPTVAQLAEKVRHIAPAESEDAEMARLLAEIEGLSEEDAERLLAEHMGKNPGEV